MRYYFMEPTDHSSDTGLCSQSLFCQASCFMRLLERCKDNYHHYHDNCDHVTWAYSLAVTAHRYDFNTIKDMSRNHKKRPNRSKSDIAIICKNPFSIWDLPTSCLVYHRIDKFVRQILLFKQRIVLPIEPKKQWYFNNKCKGTKGDVNKYFDNWSQHKNANVNIR